MPATENILQWRHVVKVAPFKSEPDKLLYYNILLLSVIKALVLTLYLPPLASLYIKSI